MKLLINIIQLHSKTRKIFKKSIIFTYNAGQVKLVKVSKFQKIFLLKLHCQKNERNIRQNSALYCLVYMLHKISPHRKTGFTQWPFFV